MGHPPALVQDLLLGTSDLIDVEPTFEDSWLVLPGCLATASLWPKIQREDEINKCKSPNVRSFFLFTSPTLGSDNGCFPFSQRFIVYRAALLTKSNAH